jgi:hypothetical protein
VALQRPLASLAGRLELLVAHMPRAGAAGEDDADAAGPLARRALLSLQLLVVALSALLIRQLRACIEHTHGMRLCSD